MPAPQQVGRAVRAPVVGDDDLEPRRVDLPREAVEQTRQRVGAIARRQDDTDGGGLAHCHRGATCAAAPERLRSQRKPPAAIPAPYASLENRIAGRRRTGSNRRARSQQPMM